MSMVDLIQTAFHPKHLIQDHTRLGRILLRIAFIPIGIVAILLGLYITMVLTPIAWLTRTTPRR